MVRLASLLRTDRMLGGSETSTLTDVLSRALAEVSKEMGFIEG